MVQSAKSTLIVIKKVTGRAPGGLKTSESIKIEFYKLHKGGMYCADVKVQLEAGKMSGSYEVSANLIFRINEITDDSMEIHVMWPVHTKNGGNEEVLDVVSDTFTLQKGEMVDKKAPTTSFDYFESFMFELR